MNVWCHSAKKIELLPRLVESAVASVNTSEFVNYEIYSLAR